MDGNQVAAKVTPRARALLTDSKQAWREIAAESGDLRDVFVPYGIVMSAIPAVIHLLRWLIFGGLLMASNPIAGSMGTLTVAWGIAVSYVITLLGFLLVGKLIEVLARTTWVKACRVLIYGSTPWFVLSIGSLIPMVGGFIELAGGIWSLILIVQGYPIVIAQKS